MVKRVIISPPFGRYIERPWATSVKGSYTFDRRNGLIRQALKTIRPTRNGWINKIGLRNKGIFCVYPWRDDVIYSFAAYQESEELARIYNYISRCSFVPDNINVEINVSCPNIHGESVKFEHVKPFIDRYEWVSVKLPPTDEAYYWLDKLNGSGVVAHLSNTIPTPKGGLSGHSIGVRNIPLIKYAKENTDLKVIAGGGVYSANDVDEYLNLGADYISLATVFFSPWRVPGVLRSLKRRGFID